MTDVPARARLLYIRCEPALSPLLANVIPPALEPVGNGFSQAAQLPRQMVDDTDASDGSAQPPAAAPAAAVVEPSAASRQLPDPMPPTRPQTAPAGSPAAGSIAKGALTVSQPWGPRAEALKVPLAPCAGEPRQGICLTV